jgi:ribosome-associated protein
MLRASERRTDPDACRMEDLVVNNRLTIPASELQASYSRSGGPGGQNVNKVASRVTLRWQVGDQPRLPPDWQRRLLARHGNRINREGEILVHSDRYRDQPRNLDDCRQRLTQWLLECEAAPVERKATRPSLGSKLRRLDNKRRVAEKKSGRRGWSD